MNVTNQIAELLCMKAGVGKRVFILFNNNQTDQLKVVSYAGERAEVEANFYVPRDMGISRKAMRERKTVYIRDVSEKDSGYVSAGLPRIGSEIAVPILSGEIQEEAPHSVGTINVQDDFTDAFTEGEISTVETFAKLMGSFIHRYSSGFESRLSTRLAVLNNLYDTEEMIDEIIDAAEELFSSPVACFIRLAPGSGFPIRPLILGTAVGFENVFSMDYWFRPDGDLIKWITDWKLKIITDLCCNTQDGQFTFDQWKDLIVSKKVGSVYFLPIGTAQIKLGAVILIFHEEQTYTLIDNVKIIRFVNEVAPHLLRIGYFYPIIKGFASPEVDLHRLTTGISKGAWEAILKDVVLSLPPEKLELITRVKRMSNLLEQSLRNIRLWIEEPKYFAFLKPENVSLTKILEESFEIIQNEYNGSVFFQCGKNVESISNELKLMIYSLAVEAVKNAFIHGITTHTVYVGITRYTNDIILDVSDDGQGCDPFIFNKNIRSQKKTGITKLIEIAEDMLGAKLDPSSVQPGLGTNLKWVIPMLPLIEEEKTNG